MDLVVSWLAFPAVMALLCGGCGLLVGAIPGVALPRALLPACGLAVVVVVGQLLVLADVTAELAVPAIAALALAGAWLGRARIARRGDLPALAAALAVFAVFAAPIVLSGEATIAGFIRLDDTATWLALTDRVIEHGRSLDGLAPSSYEATLAFNLGEGYPIGVFVPLGIGAGLLSTDVAWLIQPYMAVLAALLALALWSLAGALTSARRWRAVAAICGAQPALLYGYYLWGGVKEIAAAVLIATAAALVGRLAGSSPGATRLIPLALVSGALIGVLSAGGLIWLAPVLAAAAVISFRGLGTRGFSRQALAGAAVVGLAAIPLVASDGLLPPTSSPLTDDAAQGNLIAPLALEQVVGIWPSGDFRLSPVAEPLAYALIAIAAALALVGLGAALATRARGPLLYLAASLLGCLVILAAGSPWVDAKALATASAAIVFVAILGAIWVARSISSSAAWIAALAVVGGVAWSNALAYQQVSLAPRDQLEELELIGERIEGQGPTLMTEYQPYGVRHFLREVEPEGVSELRRRAIPLRDGELVEKGLAADTDAIDPDALAIYRTLVLRRSPAQSRPPSAYELTWAGDAYEVWQRPAGVRSSSSRIVLGDRHRPAARPDCDAVAKLARSGDLLAARAGERVVVALSGARYPAAWATAGSRDQPRPDGAGSIAATVALQRGGDYELWLEGSLRPSAQALVDGEPVGEVRHRLNNLGQYVSLGSTELEPGTHEVEIQVGGADLHPGSGGLAGPVGPLVLSHGAAAETELVEVPAAEHERLCGREWDWIELVEDGG